MVSVCVVGGGIAGAEAAREASLAGCQVTIVDARERPLPRWRSWPDLIRPPREPTPPGSNRTPPDPTSFTALLARVTFVAPHRVSTASGYCVRPDYTVVATGCGFEPLPIPGHRKPGVFVLDGPSQYEELGRVRRTLCRPLVCGEGGRALQVAERLAEEGIGVRVSVSCWERDEPSPTIRDFLGAAAAGSGVQLTTGPVTKAVGSRSLEGVIQGGRVVPCDALVVVPRRVPRPVAGPSVLGTRGGVLVDRHLTTAAPSVLAAGGCAELEGGPLTFTLEEEAAMSGRVAGANAAGGHFGVSPIRVRETCMFGFRWSKSDFGPAPGVTLGVVSHSRVDSACVLSYEVASGRIVSIEAVVKAGSSPAGSSALLPPLASLRTLAYGGGAGSSDISLVSDTARLGLEQWSRS